MTTQGKVWGKTKLIFRNVNVEIHRIEAMKDGYCSKHKHEHKFNKFFVESGLFQVDVWQEDYALIDTTILKAGESTTVKPGCDHMFKALEDSVVYEIYWVELDGKDIIRETIGGTDETV